MQPGSGGGQGIASTGVGGWGAGHQPPVWLPFPQQRGHMNTVYRQFTYTGMAAVRGDSSERC